ncbi:MAG: WecB/TagA/CpsF family glycosyltransferase [Candidatus Doudnabacteria bacterium]|nr:WecB/TagA/CpsF family glycosyltransferase [Candidatus Doudnabacteria bacterium]
MKTNIAGLNVDFTNRTDLFKSISERINAKRTTWLTTLYSEFLYLSLRDKSIQNLLNHADIALPDGISMFWAREFLRLPLKNRNRAVRYAEAIWQVTHTLYETFSKKQNIISVNEEKIPGSELVWDLAKYAAENNLTIFLLGGFGRVPELVAHALENKERRLSGKIFFSNKNPDDASILNDIKISKANIILVAYGPIKQENWIFKNIHELPEVKIFIGLGGTFDYIAGVKSPPPGWIRTSGLEWLWRLVTQPYRMTRIFNSTCGLIYELARYKITRGQVEKIAKKSYN